MCKLIKASTHREFDNCWTRTYEDDGWPSYRYYPVLFKDGTSYLSDGSFVADNVYVSLVLTKEQFLEINPEVNLI